jgi:hypothetical protein
MWSLTSPRVKRISGPEKFGSSAKKDFFNTIRHKRAFHSRHHPNVPLCAPTVDVCRSNVMERAECALLNIAGPKGIQPKSLRQPYRASGFLMRHRAGPE